MKYKYGILLIIGILFMTITNVKAIDVPACTTDEMNRLKELANNVAFKTTYETYEEKEDNFVWREYHIEIVNFDEDLQISYQYSDSKEEYRLNPDETIDNVFSEGDIVKLKIYAYTTNLCTGTLLKTVNIKMPYYNDYYHYNKEKCEQYPEFKYCKVDKDVSDVSFDKIDKLFDEYLKEEKVAKAKRSSNIIWYVIGGIGIVVVLYIGIFFIIKQKKKNADL